MNSSMTDIFMCTAYAAFFSRYVFHYYVTASTSASPTISDIRDLRTTSSRSVVFPCRNAAEIPTSAVSVSIYRTRGAREGAGTYFVCSATVTVLQVDFAVVWLGYIDRSMR